jgi:DNA-binding CsgD family transcriptional regulator
VKLTPREREILQLVAEGYSNAQLARMLWVSHETVKFHLSNIYDKLEVRNRTEATRWAHVHGVALMHPSSPGPG